MKKYLIPFIFFAVSAFCYASENLVKSLLTEIDKIEAASAENEARLRQLFSHEQQPVRITAKLKMATLYWQSGRLEEAQMILELVSNDIELYPAEYKVKTLLKWASFELRRNNYPESEVYAREALEIAKTSYKTLVGQSYTLIGASLREQRKTLEAKDFFERALATHRQNNNGAGTFDALNSLAVMYRDSGDLAKATEFLLQARDAVEKYGNKGHTAAVYYNLGDVFRDSKEPKRAIEFYQRALELDIELGDLGNVAYDYTGLALSYLDLKEYSLALQNNQKAVQNLLKVNAPQELSRAYLQQSRIYKQITDPDNRLKSLLLAEISAKESESSYQIMSVNIDKAEFDLEQENYEIARDELVTALNVANELSLDIDKLRVNKLLAKTFQQLNQHEEAYQHLSASFELEEKLNGDKRQQISERYKRDLNLLEEQLKVSKLQQVEAEQAQAIKNQEEVKQRMLVIMIASIVVFMALGIVLMQRRKIALLRADLFEEALQQKQKLFADVSHELRTPLTALKLQIQALQYDLVSNVEDSYDKLAGKVNEINRLISDIYQLAQADTKNIELHKYEVSLNEVFERWQSDWQNTVENQGFAWQCQLSLGEESKVLDPERIKQVVDNLLSNACVYTDKPGIIALRAKVRDGELIVSVEDSAPTVPKDKLDKIFTRLYRVESSRSRQTGGSGLGLAICESLVHAHGGTIIARQSGLGGLKVSFKL